MSGTLSPRQKAYIRKKSKVHDLDPSEASGELNIVPFLDIVVNIIMFLLTLTACGTAPPAAGQSDCTRYGYASMQCQVEMYARAGQ